MRYDTTFVTVRDQVVRVDTVRVPVVRVDTAWYPAYREPQPAPALPRMLYGSLYTGMTMPSGNVDRLYTDGFHAGVAFGIDDDSSPFGLRFSTGVSRLGRENVLASVVGTTTPWLIETGLDAKLMTPASEGFRLYGIGGVNFNAYKGIATASKSGSGVFNADGRGGWYQPARNSGWMGAFGLNAGAGADMLVGGQDLFLEGRVMTLQRDGARTWLIPVSFGLRFF